MKVEYVVVDTGEILDVVTVPESGPLEYRTGAASDRIRTIERVVGSRDKLIAALRGWTNGYVQLRETSAAG